MRIKAQLQSAVVRVGDTHELAIEVQDSPAPITYAWTKDNAAHGNSGPKLILKPVEPAHAGTYAVVATDKAGATTMSSATLSVVDPSAAVVWPQWDDKVAKKAAGWMGGALAGVAVLAIAGVFLLIQQDVELEPAHVAAPCAVLLILLGMALGAVSAWVIVMDTRLRLRTDDVLLPTPHGPSAVVALSAWRGAMVIALASAAMVAAGVLLLVTMLE